MKKILGLALLASVFTTSAFASVARLEALGEDQFGSQYVDDNRNAFLNAATINDHFDYTTFEWGDTNSVINAEGTPKAQGGIFRKSGRYVYGVYFGADSNTGASLRSGIFSALAQTGAMTQVQANVLASQAQNENTISFFLGGESLWKWGARVEFAGATNEQGITSGGVTIEEVNKKGWLAGLGAIKGKNEVYLNLGTGNELEYKNIAGLATGPSPDPTTAATGGVLFNGNDYEFKGKLGYQFGYVRSLDNGAKAFVEYRSQEVEEDGIDALDEVWKIQRLDIGWAKTSKLNDKFTAFYKAIYHTSKQENFVFLDQDDDVEESFLKTTVGFEIMAKDWLIFRGSIASNLFGEEQNADGDKSTIADSTDVRLGATLAFGDFAIDGLIGNDADGNGIAGDDNGTIRTDALMSRVSMTYKF